MADDPETLRIKQNTRHFSNVAYHGDLAKKAAMEKQREVAEVSDNRGSLCLFLFICIILLYRLLSPLMCWSYVHHFVCSLFTLSCELCLSSHINTIEILAHS